jgi:hypothetical protein
VYRKLPKWTVDTTKVIVKYKQHVLIHVNFQKKLLLYYFKLGRQKFKLAPNFKNRCSEKVICKQINFTHLKIYKNFREFILPPKSEK